MILTAKGILGDEFEIRGVIKMAKKNTNKSDTNTCGECGRAIRGYYCKECAAERERAESE